MTTLNSVLLQNFAEALNKNDISLVRAMLIAELNDSNVNIDDVLNIIAHIENSTMTLFDGYNVSPFFQAIDENTANWTKDYFAMQLVYLNKNFSRERLLHLANVHRVLFASAPSKQAVEQLTIENVKPVSEQINNTISNSVDVSNKVLAQYDAPQQLADLIQKGDLDQARAILIADLNDSKLNAQDVLQMGMYAESQNKAIFEDYKISAFAKEIDENTANWNADYFSMQLVYLNKNFSRERFLHLVNVNQALFAKAEQKQSEKQPHFEPEIVVEQQIEEPKVHQVEELFVHHSEEPTESRVEEVVELTTYSSTTSSKTQYHTEYEPKSNSQTDEEDTSHTSYRDEPVQSHSIWKTALKIGGAVAAIVIGLIAILK